MSDILKTCSPVRRLLNLLTDSELDQCHRVKHRTTNIHRLSKLQRRLLLRQSPNDAVVLRRAWLWYHLQLFVRPAAPVPTPCLYQPVRK